MNLRLLAKNERQPPRHRVATADDAAALAGACDLVRLPSGEWVPDLPPDQVRWEANCKKPEPDDFPEIPWFPVGFGGDGDLVWRRCVPISREAACWPPLARGEAPWGGEAWERLGDKR